MSKYSTYFEFFLFSKVSHYLEILIVPKGAAHNDLVISQLDTSSSTLLRDKRHYC